MIDFCIIGAPKCGTTTLANWLTEHPEIDFSRLKEPHTYAEEIVDAYPEESYHTLFKNTPNTLKGEGSTWYLWSKTARSKIRKDNPNAKFIICVRNPSKMALSLHNHFYFYGNENIANPSKAWQLIENRKKGKNLPIWQKNPDKLDYKRSCNIGTMLQNTIKDFGEDNILIVELEKLSVSPEDVYKNVCSFLNIDQKHKPSFEKKNEGKVRKSKILLNLHIFIREKIYLSKSKLMNNRVTKILKIKKMAFAIQKFLDTKNRKKGKIYADKDFEIFLERVFEPEVDIINALKHKHPDIWA